MPQLVSYTKDIVIALNGSLSAAIDLGAEGGRLHAIAIPSDWTAADLTFQGSIEGSTFNNIYDELGSELTVKAAASRYVLVPIASFLGLRHLKIRSGTSGTPVLQLTGDKTLRLGLLG